MDIKKFIDSLAFHKMNIFHWHLTEDQGWRIEIKKFPRLTEIGAWRESSPAYGNVPAGTRHLRLRVTAPQTNWLIIHEIKFEKSEP